MDIVRWTLCRLLSRLSLIMRVLVMRFRGCLIMIGLPFLFLTGICGMCIWRLMFRLLRWLYVRWCWALLRGRMIINLNLLSYRRGFRVLMLVLGLLLILFLCLVNLLRSRCGVSGLRRGRLVSRLLALRFWVGFGILVRLLAARLVMMLLALLVTLVMMLLVGLMLLVNYLFCRIWRCLVVCVVRLLRCPLLLLMLI